VHFSSFSKVHFSTVLKSRRCLYRRPARTLWLQFGGLLFFILFLFTSVFFFLVPGIGLVVAASIAGPPGHFGYDLAGCLLSYVLSLLMMVLWSKLFDVYTRDWNTWQVCVCVCVFVCVVE